jgi:hypothetical protein
MVWESSTIKICFITITPVVDLRDESRDVLDDALYFTG